MRRETNIYTFMIKGDHCVDLYISADVIIRQFLRDLFGSYGCGNCIVDI